ncbi:MAG: hypothetical protein RO469_05735 [Thermincola sp.]|jgi:hypothetical protein|nr:hypothetical protein [Thermincola sp.]MDT3701705.1 hypothetical protein [Thermincola sp.]
MTKVNIESGVCGFCTSVQAEPGAKYTAKLTVESTCPHVQKIAENFGEVNAMKELFKKGQSQIMELCNANLPHITCPVPIGILKALEVSTGMALPKEAKVSFNE